MVTNPRLLPFPIASTTGELADADQVVVSNTGLTGLLNSSNDVQRALLRIDHTGLGAPIFTFTGSYAAAAANISEWFNGQSTRHLQGAEGQANGLFTFDLPGTAALNTVFDSLVTDGLPESYTLTISYLGGTAGTSINTNRLLVRPRTSPSPQIDGRANITLANGDSVTLQISRSSGTIGSYVVISEGRLPGTAGADTLGDIELRTQTWDATNGATLPGTGQVQQGWAFRVINAPTDGSGRFNQVLYTNDWVVWSAISFTQWADTANWFVIAASDVRRLTLAGQQFLEHVGTKSVIVRGNDYADQAGEIRIQLYQNSGDYTPGDLNTNGQIDQYTNTSDLPGYRIAVRLDNNQAAILTTLPSLYIYVEDVRGNFTRSFNLSTDFTHQGDFSGESDYLANADFNYRAGDILRIYVTSTSSFNTISDYQAIDNIDDGSIEEVKFSTPVQDKLNSHGPVYDLPPALQALNNQARVFNITHSNYRSNSSHVVLNNSLAVLKNAPTVFPNTASTFANEITGSAASVGDPSPVTAIQDVSRATNNILTGAGITGAQFPITLIDEYDWRLIIGGWMYYQTLPTTYEPILQIQERFIGSAILRDIFGMGPGGLTFKNRSAIGSSENQSVRHPLVTTEGFVLQSLTASNLSATWRVYTGGTYFIQVEGFNGGVSTGGQGKDFTITAVNQDQAQTTETYNIGAGTQSLNITYDASRSLYGGRAHGLTIEATSLIAGVDELRIRVESAPGSITATTNNTYTDVTLSEGHAAPARLMRYVVVFRSIGGVETGNLQAVIGFFGYDSAGVPTYFEENVINLNYQALDLEWNSLRYGAPSGSIGIHQNVQLAVLNPDTPLIEYPTHEILNGWLSSHDNKQNDWVWGNIHGPDQDTEAVYFPEFVNFSNFILESPNRTRFRLTIDDTGALKTEVVT